jgi:hypothetical protein
MDIEQWLYSLPPRLRSFFHPNQVDEEMKEELREHLEQQIRENIAKGMAPEEARRSAVLTMGGIPQIEQECRDALGGSVLQDFLRARIGPSHGPGRQPGQPAPARHFARPAINRRRSPLRHGGSPGCDEITRTASL